MVMVLLMGTVFAAPAQAASTTTKKTVSSNTTVPIPDWAPHVDASIGFGASYIEASGIVGNITRVTASVYISHGNVADLDAAIIGPDGGTYSYLFTAAGISGTSLGTGCADADRTTFDDAAATSIDAGTSPYGGTFRPEDALAIPLSVFNANAAGTDGTWEFEAVDSVTGNVGTIECWSLFIQTDAAEEPLRFDSTGASPISDNVDESGGPGIADSPITVTGLNGTVSNVTVSVSISHTQDSDLDVELISPTGQVVKLAARVGGTGNGFGTSCSKTTTFDDAAKTSISQGTAPYVGTFKPSQALTGARGGDASGDWTLRVVDNSATKVGQINCWSLSVTATITATATGVQLTPRLTSPSPLPGAYNYAYLTIKNNTGHSLDNVTLTGTLSDTLSDVREDPYHYPNCDVNVQQFTCTWASIGPGETVVGGAVALVGNPKKGKVCLDGAVTATGINTVKASACFPLSAYATGDRGTGWDIGNIAHNLKLQDQSGNPVALSDFAGKYVLLQFTAVWCPPSNFEVPQDRDEIAALNESNAMGVEVVYLQVLVDGPTPGTPSTQTNAVNWANHFNLTTRVLWTANDANKSTMQEHLSYAMLEGSLTTPAYPTSIFIRPNGEVFGVRIGVDPSGGTTDRFLNDLP
jgi:subtilisin-like proprotein convertase family protein